MSKSKAKKKMESDPRYTEITASGGQAPSLQTAHLPGGGIAYYDNLGAEVQESRDRALRVNQREQLRSQNQEIAQLTLQRRRRSSGRQSLLNAMPKPSTLGPSGTLG